jgi:hypothetical protein
MTAGPLQWSAHRRYRSMNSIVALHDHKVIAGHHSGYYGLLHGMRGPGAGRKLDSRRTVLSQMSSDAEQRTLKVSQPDRYEVLLTHSSLLHVTLYHQHHWHASPLWAKAPWIFRQQDFYRVELPTPHPTPKLEDQASIFMTPRDRVAQLYPQVLGTHVWATFRLFLSSGQHSRRYFLYLKNVLYWSENDPLGIEKYNVV